MHFRNVPIHSYSGMCSYPLGLPRESCSLFIERIALSSHSGLI